MGNYNVFISYRREGGDTLAHYIYDRLTKRGYNVFYDIDSLHSGPFKEVIYDKIEKCDNFICIFTPNALNRCYDEGDWVRNEIAFALKEDKNIIPIICPDFRFPKNLPEDIKKISEYNGIEFSSSYFDAFVNKLEDFFVLKKPHFSQNSKNNIECPILVNLIVKHMALAKYVMEDNGEPFDPIYRGCTEFVQFSTQKYSDYYLPVIECQLINTGNDNVALTGDLKCLRARFKGNSKIKEMGICSFATPIQSEEPIIIKAGKTIKQCLGPSLALMIIKAINECELSSFCLEVNGVEYNFEVEEFGEAVFYCKNIIGTDYERIKKNIDRYGHE